MQKLLIIGTMIKIVEQIKTTKEYWNQKASKPPRKEFHLPYFFEMRSESKEEEEEEDVTIL